jgi:hypothetical protein
MNSSQELRFHFSGMRPYNQLGFETWVWVKTIQNQNRLSSSSPLFQELYLWLVVSMIPN